MFGGSARGFGGSAGVWNGFAVALALVLWFWSWLWQAKKPAVTPSDEQHTHDWRSSLVRFSPDAALFRRGPLGVGHCRPRTRGFRVPMGGRIR